MNKIKLSDSDKRLLIIFFAILMVAASYFFFFNKNMSKASDIEDSNTKDQAQVQQMEQMEAALPQVRENMKKLKQKQADIIAKYPSDIKTEKVIWILQDIEDHNDYHISDITFIELNSDLVLEEGKLEEETKRVLGMIQDLIRKGTTVCVSTQRALLKVENDTPEEALKRAVKISDALQKCVGELEVTPAFVVAKGGITSSDVGVKALRVKHAKVLGQIRPGIPVWQTGAESRFPGIPYIIFPGNVGEIVTLREAVEILMNR